MDFEAGFLSDNTYGVTHLNRLTQSLVTKGIVDYPFPTDESSIGTFNINGFVQFLSEDGVIPETYKSMLVEKNDTGYILNPGMAFLDNGIYIFVENVQEFTCEPGMKVYWLHNTLTDKVEFMCTEDYPSSGAYLPLAEILEDGSVSNVRKSARAKLPGMASDYNMAKKITVKETLITTRLENQYYPWGDIQVDLGGNNYKYLLIVGQQFLISWALINLETKSTIGSYPYEHSKMALNISNDASFTINPKEYYNSQWRLFYTGKVLNISEEGLLTLGFGAWETWDIGTPINIDIDIYAF